MPSRYANPDAIWTPLKNFKGVTRGRKYAIEIKSSKFLCKSGHGQIGAGRIAISKAQWKEAKKLARDIGGSPIVVVELILPSPPNTYWILTARQVNAKMRKSYASFSTWQITRVAHRID